MYTHQLGVPNIFQSPGDITVVKKESLHGDALWLVLTTWDSSSNFWLDQ